MAATIQEPRVLTIKLPGGKLAGQAAGGSPVAPALAGIEALPSGPLEAEHRTLEIGLRSWVERQTSQRLGYVEQLYTFGDRDRSAGDDAFALPALVVAYLALVREARPAGAADAEWHSWYRYFPWEDWRDGRPALLDPIAAALARWARRAGGEAERRLREERVGLAFGLALGPSGAAWNEELVLERYELLYEAGLVSEAGRDLGRPAAAPDRFATEGLTPDGLTPDGLAPNGPATGAEMAVDHRRILATAIGRLRGKIKYRPVVFELMPPAFTLLAAAAHGRGAGRGAAAQAEFPPPRRAAGAGRGDRRDQRPHRRPPGAARAVSPRGVARTPGPRPAPAPRRRPPGHLMLTAAMVLVCSVSRCEGAIDCSPAARQQSPRVPSRPALRASSDSGAGSAEGKFPCGYAGFVLAERLWYSVFFSHFQDISPRSAG